MDIREGRFLSEFPERLRELRASGLRVFVLFFEASDEALVRRFSETRRPHPAEAGDGLLESIRRERGAMSELRRLADQVIDTSEHTVHTLRRLLVERFGAESAARVRVQVYSFATTRPPHDVDCSSTCGICRTRTSSPNCATSRGTTRASSDT